MLLGDPPILQICMRGVHDLNDEEKDYAQQYQIVIEGERVDQEADNRHGHDQPIPLHFDYDK